MKQNKKIILTLSLIFLLIIIFIIILSSTIMKEEKNNFENMQNSTQDLRIEQELTINVIEKEVTEDEITGYEESTYYIPETSVYNEKTTISYTSAYNNYNKSFEIKSDETTTQPYTSRNEDKLTVDETVQKDNVIIETTTKKQENKTTEEATLPVFEEETITEQITIPSVEEETTNNIDYDDVVLKLNDKIIEKGYEDELKKLIRNILSSLSKNYDSYLDLYKFSGMPSKEEYIMEHLVYALDDVGGFEIYDYNSEEAQYMLNYEYASIGSIDPSNLVIQFIYGSGESEREQLFHEISHAKNKECFSFINNPNEYILYRYDIFIEGHATFNQQFTNNLVQYNGGSWHVSNSNGNTIMYMKNNCLGYLQYYNIYSNLLLLAGYDTMEEVSKNADLNILKVDLKEKYGNDIAEKIFECMNYITYTDIDKDLRYNKCIEFQNLVIDALCMQVDKLKTKKEVEDYLEFYKLYQNFILPKVHETDDIFNSKEITYELFNLEKLESILVNKCIEHEVIDREYDTNLKKAILKVILYYKNKQYGFYDNLNYTLLNLPVVYRDIQINSVKYLDKKYYINISYEDKLYCLNDMSKLYIDMEYVLDEKFNIIDVYNTNYKYIYNEEMN